MAKHEITLYKNTGATADVAPYLGKYVNKGRLDWQEILKDTSSRCGMPVDEVEAILDGVFAEIIDLELKTPTRIDLGFATARVTITGSFDSSDAQFNPTKNTYEISLSFNKDITNALVDIVPNIVSEEGSTSVRLSNVFSKTSPRPYGVLRLGEVARGTGKNLVFTDEDAGVKLQDVKTGAFIDIPSEGVTSLTKQVFEFTIPQNMQPGDYKVWIYSRGGDAEGALQSASYRVKVIEVPPPQPTITSVTNGARAEGHFATDGTAVNVMGTLLSLEAPDNVYLDLTMSSGVHEKFNVTEQVTNSGATGIDFGDGISLESSTHTKQDWVGGTVKLIVEREGYDAVEHRVYVDAE